MHAAPRWRGAPGTHLAETAVIRPSAPRSVAPLRRLVVCDATAALKVVLYDLYDQQVPYEEAWRWQRQLVQTVHELSTIGKGDVAGAVLLLQHPPVYTLGAGATEDHLRFDPESPPLPVYRTERGGEVTYHGPGQLVMYPLLDLRRFQTDLHWYLRSLEDVVIRALEEVSGLQGARVEGLTGVWVGGCKVAAMGVRATKWVTYHGLALNVTTDLAPFTDIVPCGISDRGVTSVANLLLQSAQAADPFAGGELLAESHGLRHGAATGAGTPTLAVGSSVEQLEALLHSLSPPEGASQGEQRLLEEYRYGLVAALEEVFGIEVEWLSGEQALAQLRGLT